jgi:hypothetical protein
MPPGETNQHPRPVEHRWREERARALRAQQLRAESHCPHLVRAGVSARTARYESELHRVRAGKHRRDRKLGELCRVVLDLSREKVSALRVEQLAVVRDTTFAWIPLVQRVRCDVLGHTSAPSNRMQRRARHERDSSCQLELAVSVRDIGCGVTLLEVFRC